MNDFGHFGAISKAGFCVDAWGAGPFIIVAANRESYRFEDSDQFGPSLVTRRGDIATTQPGERSPFWRAHWLWVKQGRRLEDDGERCVFHEPKPTIWTEKNRELVLVEQGEDGGQNILDGRVINFGDQP